VSDDPSDEKKRRRFFTRQWEATSEPVTGVWAERRRLAEAMRLVIERLTTSDAPEEELRVAADRLEEYAERLGHHPRRDRYEGFAEAAIATRDKSQGGDWGGHYDYSPLIGRSNPLAPPIEMRAEEDKVVARVTFGSAYEGPPGCVHGGFVAAAFDEVLGYAQSLSGRPGMTGTLTTIYRTPTPLHTELAFEAWIDRTEGRKLFVKGTLHAPDRLCAECEGIFISMRPGLYQKLVAQRADREPR